MEHKSFFRYGFLSFTVIAALTLGWFAGPAAALEDHEWMYPGYDTGWTGGDAMVGPSTYRMHASDEPLFILQTWFAAALSYCDDPIVVDEAWNGWYFNKDYPYPDFINPATGDDGAGFYCHTGSLQFDFDVDGSLWDDVTYLPLTWGLRWDGSSWGYLESGSGAQEETLYWYDTLTGLPVIHVTDSSMEGAPGVANIGHLYFWPYAGIMGDWTDAFGVIDDGYYCIQDNGDECWKDVLVYQGNSAYTVRAYYLVYDGIDSDIAWDGEADPNDGSPLNDFNILWTPGSSIPEQNYIVLSNELDNECACDIDRRWHHTDPDEFPETECDLDITNFDDAADYATGLAFLNAMDICDETITNMSIQHYGFPDSMDYVNGVTDGGSIGVRNNYGTYMEPRNGDRLVVMSSGDIGGNSVGSSGFSAQWWSWSSGTGHIDYALPTYKQLCASAMCCPQTDYRYDHTMIQFDIEVPPTAEGVSYDVAFFTQEYPEWAGTYYNDGFEAVFEDPKVATWTANPDFPGYVCDADGDGVSEANVAFDGDGTPLRVNNHFLTSMDCTDFGNVLDHNGHIWEATVTDVDWTYSASVPCCSYTSEDFERVCDVPSWWASSYPWTCPSFGYAFSHWGLCGGGAGEDSGGTQWLTNAFGVTGGNTMTVRFSIYDKSDGIFDTSVILDNWTWMGEDPGSPTLYEPPSTAFVGSPN